MRLKSICFVMAVLYVAGFCYGAGTVDSVKVELPKVLILGDSISLGYTKDVRKQLEGKAVVSRARGGFVNCGNSGRYIEQMDKWLGDTKWDIIHFNCGLWDICHRHEDSKAYGQRDKVKGTIMHKPDEYEANLRKIVARLKETGAKLIWANTTPVPDGEAGRIKGDEVKYNAIAAKVMAENKIAINDLYSYMLPKAKGYWTKPGDVHFTKEGSKYLASKVAAMIELAIKPVTMKLWPAGAPGALGQGKKDIPDMTVYLPMGGNANGIAVLVCPGGGYGHLSMGHEGKDIAEWLNSFGTTAVVLNYRHKGKGYGYPAPLDDAQRAMRIVRSKSALWGIDANKIGVIGFSAGGHLASTVTTLFDKGYGKAGDEVDKISSRPDFSVLCYAVISMSEPFMHRGSRRNLLGKEYDEKLAELMSTDKQITAKTPPAFLIHSGEDTVVPVENSIAFYTGLRKAKVRAEMHIYEKGGHGFGLAKRNATAKQWPDACRQWILAVTSSN
jgi:acetyl esterase/lipase